MTRMSFFQIILHVESISNLVSILTILLTLIEMPLSVLSADATAEKPLKKPIVQNIFRV